MSSLNKGSMIDTAQYPILVQHHAAFSLPQANEKTEDFRASRGRATRAASSEGTQVFLVRALGPLPF